jgi:hypothetical protein
MRSPVADRILMPLDSQSISLSPKARKQVKDNGKHNTKQDGTGQRKIEGCMFAAVRDISRQAAEWNSGFAEQQNEAAKQEEKHPEAHQHAT